MVEQQPTKIHERDSSVPKHDLCTRAHLTQLTYYERPRWRNPRNSLIANVYTQLRWTRVFHGRTSKDSEHVCMEVHYRGNELLRYIPRFSSSLPFNPIRGNRWTDEPDSTSFASLSICSRVDQTSTSCIVQCNRCPIVHWACFLIPRRRRESYFEFVRRKGVVWKWTPLNRLKTAHAASLLKVSPWKNFRLKKYLLGSMKT